MAILGDYTGDSSKSSSYLYGIHWSGIKGFRVVQGNSIYNHRFGGSTWTVPKCENCKEAYQQIFTFDLKDSRLKDIKINGVDELPLVSCLNCSSSWGRQVFKLDVNCKSVEIISIEDTEKWVQENDDRIPSPLPEVNVKLVDMADEDIPVDMDTYYNIFDSFGEDYICRLLGPPLYVQAPINRECPHCKREMQYIATIGSQSYGSKDSIIEGVDFFIGEMTLYYLLCKDCMIITTECQGT